MEKNVEKKYNSKNSLYLIIIVLIISIILSIAVITLNYFSSKDHEKTNVYNNPTQESFIDEDYSNITSVMPDEEIETNKTESTNIEMPLENVNQESNNISTDTSASPILPENNANVNQASSSNSNNISNQNSPSHIEENPVSDSTVIPSTPEETPYKVKTETSTELIKTENKYGVIINTYTTSTYDLYSDGSKIVKSSYNTIEYDRANYNATTSELLPEARTTRSQYSSWINQVFKNVNAYRQEANNNCVNNITSRSSLSLSEDLCVAACARAVEMAYSSKFSHTRPNGSKCYSILKEMNISYSTAGENIAYGYSSADSASEGWKNSAGHYSNMISPDFSKIGIGVFKLEETYYWVQLFI